MNIATNSEFLPKLTKHTNWVQIRLHAENSGIGCGNNIKDNTAGTRIAPGGRECCQYKKVFKFKKMIFVLHTPSSCVSFLGNPKVCEKQWTEKEERKKERVKVSFMGGARKLLGPKISSNFF